jgi:hypothetical protein
MIALRVGRARVAIGPATAGRVCTRVSARAPFDAGCVWIRTTGARIRRDRSAATAGAAGARIGPDRSATSASAANAAAERSAAACAGRRLDQRALLPAADQLTTEEKSARDDKEPNSFHRYHLPFRERPP